MEFTLIPNYFKFIELADELQNDLNSVIKIESTATV